MMNSFITFFIAVGRLILIWFARPKSIAHNAPGR